VQRFRGLVAARDVAALAIWLADARASGLAPFVSLATGIEADRGAVDAALTTPWSNGPVEGHVNRVKSVSQDDPGRSVVDGAKCIHAGCGVGEERRLW
jgi:transposase